MNTTSHKNTYTHTAIYIFLIYEKCLRFRKRVVACVIIENISKIDATHTATTTIDKPQ